MLEDALGYRAREIILDEIERGGQKHCHQESPTIYHKERFFQQFYDKEYVHRTGMVNYTMDR